MIQIFTGLLMAILMLISFFGGFALGFLNSNSEDEREVLPKDDESVAAQKKEYENFLTYDGTPQEEEF